MANFFCGKCCDLKSTTKHWQHLDRPYIDIPKMREIAQGMTRSSVRHAFDQAVEKAGIEGITSHTLRHTFATRLAQAGINLYDIKELMGHESIKTTERYAHHCPQSLRPSVMVLDNIPDMEQLGAALQDAIVKAQGERE